MKDVAVALTLADEPALSALLRADPATAIREVEDLPPLLVLLRRSTGSRAHTTWGRSRRFWPQARRRAMRSRPVTPGSMPCSQTIGLERAEPGSDRVPLTIR
jgi:hypothetical protein